MAPPLRTPHLNLSSILSSQTPQIDLKTDAYEASARNFLKALGDYTNSAITKITRRRDAHDAEKKRLLDKAQLIQNEANQCKLKEIDLLAALERQQAEAKEAESCVSTLRRQVASLHERCAARDAEIEQYRVAVANLQRKKNDKRATLDALASQVLLELRACEECLQSSIEGVDQDRLLVRFMFDGLTDSPRECSFVLDVGGPDYHVLATTPALPLLPILVDRLNETRNIFSFIKEMREQFCTSLI
ncbi:hypothetical protein EWM64_g3535 [Hericium alpestre]|uniref:Kinetochore protein SPC25 n=1 Tax=Hericium alpestre TaxID=135208 RepID=A0A4Z0A2B6_9AGAM|nr:hypothetical protein EWM64_g3535 [Hericium alpestre]